MRQSTRTAPTQKPTLAVDYESPATAPGRSAGVMLSDTVVGCGQIMLGLISALFMTVLQMDRLLPLRAINKPLDQVPIGIVRIARGREAAKRYQP